MTDRECVFDCVRVTGPVLRKTGTVLHHRVFFEKPLSVSNLAVAPRSSSTQSEKSNCLIPW